ncbi:exonuclease domain-containing protein [Streptomyces sp. C1-2]|uniref:exonuclease domain-containing protein n=1 Tax=Streptomyces sp. C1-2 TaxID=2720022 RepID=UPI0014323C31|nr:exonuclease domain-containing protein [Streptomyces sp. C1-2]NJP71930.1 DNA polymerase III subunit epsilon [Streptomyces sp. C1-2]
MWHTLRLGAFDLETTGVDVEQDRIVTAAVHGLGGGQPADPHDWFVNPGVDIPEEASKIHGITTEEAQAKGEPAPGAVDAIADTLAGYARQEALVVGHNVVYDLTLLDRELRRYSLPLLADRLGGSLLHVVDTRVLDTRAVPFRKRVSEKQGARQLITLAQFYGIAWDDGSAHGASYDAVIAARVAYRIGQLAHMRREDWPDHVRAQSRVSFAPFQNLTPGELHAAQIGWAEQQAAGLQKFFRRTDPQAVVDGSWPMRPWADKATEGES